MVKHILVISILVALHMYIEAAPNANNHNVESGKSLKVEQAGPKLDNERYGLTEASKDNDDKDSQGQRQKRFNNYFSFGFSPYDSFVPTYVKRDQSQETGNFGAENTLSVISRQVLDLLNYTRQRALSPAPFQHFPVPSFVPVVFVPRSHCDCTPDNNERPINDEPPNHIVPTPPPTPMTTSRTPNKPPTISPTTDNVPPVPLPTDDTTITSPDFSVRLPETTMDSNVNDYEDGARPISFNPVKPNKPMSRLPPPVDHGSKQAGGNAQVGNSAVGSSVVPVTTIPPPPVSGVAARPELPTNAIPTLCDGAILTCCHRLEVTYDCFLKQGCPDPTPVNNPCDDNNILEIVRKFQYYYANRRG